MSALGRQEAGEKEKGDKNFLGIAQEGASNFPMDDDLLSRSSAEHDSLVLAQFHKCSNSLNNKTIKERRIDPEVNSIFFFSPRAEWWDHSVMACNNRPQSKRKIGTGSF